MASLEMVYVIMKKILLTILILITPLMSFPQAATNDFGDAPVSYGSADHYIDGTARYLGSKPDAEASQQYSLEADGDDLTGIDDEDGVTFPVLTQGTSVAIPVRIVTSTLLAVYLNVWIDWNGDGDFDDSGERVVTDYRRTSSQTYNMPVNIPVDAIAVKPTFARFRLGPKSTSSPDYTSTGAASFGEVEDYMIRITCAKVDPPKVGEITQPDCKTVTGSVTLNGLPATGTWALTRLPDGVTMTGTGTTTTIAGLAPGTWSYTVTNASGCTSDPSGNVVILPTPASPAPPVIDTIMQPTCTFSTGRILLTGLPATGTWILTRYPDGATFSGTGISITITGLELGTYYFTVLNSEGCISPASPNAVINPQPATPATPSIGTITHPTCEMPGGTVVLSSLPSQGVWTLTRLPGSITSTGTGTSTTVSGLEPGTYNFYVANEDECTSGVSANVIINPRPGPVPSVIVTNPEPVCSPATVNLTAPSVVAGSTEGLIYSYWLDILASIPYNTPAAATAGTYYIKGTTTSGCSDIKPVVVTVLVQPVADAGPDQILHYQFTTDLDANLPGENLTGDWSVISGSGHFADANNAKTTVTNLAVGENILSWAVSNGVCSPSSDNVSITVYDLKIPTLITPNYDNLNDFFVLQGLESLGKTSLTIIDRRGALVFENAEYDNKWDGVDYNGNPIPDDTYYYIITPENRIAATGYIVVRR